MREKDPNFAAADARERWWEGRQGDQISDENCTAENSVKDQDIPCLDIRWFTNL